nr:GPP34 family phosphoprotein [Hoyosella altamirensis]
MAVDLNLLLLDPRKGRPLVDNARCDFATSAAVLRQLEEQGRISVKARGRFARTWTIRVTDMTPIGDPVTDTALRNLGGRPKTVREAMFRYGQLWRQTAYAVLAERGVIQYERRKYFRLTLSDRWKVTDINEHERLRTALSDAVLNGGNPDTHWTALIALLYQVNVVPVLFPEKRKEAKRRAADIAHYDWASEALRKALEVRRRAMVVLTPHMFSVSTTRKPRPETT